MPHVAFYKCPMTMTMHASNIQVPMSRSTPPPEEHDACGVGFVADLGGPASHRTIELALQAAAAMKHRGARSADGRTGDGAGILCETPRRLLVRELALVDLRASANHLAALCIFLPREADAAAGARAAIESSVRQAEVTPLRWRVPATQDDLLGEQARAGRPAFEQLVVDMGPGNVRERMRAAARALERTLREFGPSAALLSCSSTSVVYKALLSSDELGPYFDDLRDPAFASRFAIFHQRFSTNTSPSWRMVQPFRHVAHNGEINTITGNRAWLEARGIRTLPGASDSHDLNAAVDAMVGAGYRVDEAVDLLLAPAIEASDVRLRAYYDAHVPTVEPWDGPAALVFADADTVGAALDRAGLRPLRWCRTAGNVILAASETGVVDFGDDPIVRRGRLGPGGRLIVRFASGEVVETEHFRAERRERADFREVVRSWQLAVHDAPPPGAVSQLELERDARRFGCTREELKDVVGVLAAGSEPTFSMGDDAAPAFFEGGVPVASYLRERFAQVTNPPIDPLREALVFDLRAWVGSGDVNGDVPAPNAVVALDSAILSEHDFDALRVNPRLAQRVLSLGLGEHSLRERLFALAAEAERAVHDGATLLVLDDREGGPSVPGLLAAGAIHQRLVARGLRMQASIALADGYARDAHAVAAAIAVGANVVTPWLGLRLAAARGDGTLYLKGLRAGLLKILAKLGICTLRSYIGAQTFEALGLHGDVVQTCFPGMKAHLPTVRFEALEEDVRGWFAASRRDEEPLRERGSYRYRRAGVRRSFDPDAIKQLRASALRGDYEAFERLSDGMEGRAPVTVRDLLVPLALREPLPLDEIESVGSIVGRFATAAMSHGALAAEVHSLIARAANRAGARSNSGEGGEDPARYSREFDLGRSKIKQVASSRFGVGVAYLASADELEIKMAQGSKPGEGGQIPGFKVSDEIARLRGATAGLGLISPPPHHDIYSIEDLAQLIYDLRRAAPHARIAVKLVAQSGIGYVASGVAKADADVIHISGHDGGTGASPLGSILYAGLPWEIGLVETHHALLANGLRSRVRLRVDGGFKSGRDVVLAALLGADEFGFGSALLVALGCIYARQCHKNTCPVGIATQDPALRAKFAGTEEEAIAFLEFVARDVRRRLARLGARSLEELHGRSDLLRRRPPEVPGLDEVDLSQIMRLPERPQPARRPPLEPTHLDDLVPRPWIGSASLEPVELPIRPADRAVGARLAHEFAVRRAAGERTGTLRVRYRGSAGQSFGAFLTTGMSLELHGDANDYVGKSMEGGRVSVLGFGPALEPVAGNACFYGARGGEGFLRGLAGERFAVRNSGAELVAEGAGDHACEYMTAGTVVLLGPVGRNFASGMSGGVAFVATGAPFDAEPPPLALGPTDCLLTELGPGDPDAERLRELLERFVSATGSLVARRLLETWPASLAGFRKLAPAPQPAASAPEARLVSAP
jgi:glutamate synthase domain-containing protein 2/glutamate synthase domain-containing protein 1/glutamate synthase domain-containing protein 3